MNIAINSFWQQYIKEQIDSGQYPSVEGVVQDALKLLKERQRSLNELRGEIEKGIAQAEQGLLMTLDRSALEGIKLEARKEKEESASKQQ